MINIDGGKWKKKLLGPATKLLVSWHPGQSLITSLLEHVDVELNPFACSPSSLIPRTHTHTQTTQTSINSLLKAREIWAIAMADKPLHWFLRQLCISVNTTTINCCCLHSVSINCTGGWKLPDVWKRGSRWKAAVWLIDQFIHFQVLPF